MYTLVWRDSSGKRCEARFDVYHSVISAYNVLRRAGYDPHVWQGNKMIAPNESVSSTGKGE